MDNRCNVITLNQLIPMIIVNSRVLGISDEVGGFNHRHSVVLLVNIYCNRCSYLSAASTSSTFLVVIIKIVPHQAFLHLKVRVFVLINT